MINIHIPEPIGAACSIIGSVTGWVYLQVRDSAYFNINFDVNKTIVSMGVGMCVFACGIVALIWAMEKWNKWREKVNSRKFDEFERKNKK